MSVGNHPAVCQLIVSIGFFLQGSRVPPLKLDSLIAMVLDVTLFGPLVNVFSRTQDVPLPQLEVPPFREIGGIKAQLLECLRSGLENVKPLWPYAVADPVRPDQVGSHASFKAGDCGSSVVVDDGGAVSMKIREVVLATRRLVLVHPVLGDQASCCEAR